jgi:NAD-dependent dihydropyrimidine dehydrogenase PreA subunit
MAISINDGICTGCESCVEACPLGIIEVNDAVATVSDADSCIECGACVDTCAFEAISL